jgi:uncharacterized protein YggE
MRTHVLLSIVFILSVTAASGQPLPEHRLRPSITATGDAVVTAQPDRAVIEIGVVTQAPTAQAAASQNAARLDAVIRELRAAAGSGAEIKTVSYSVDPDYRETKQGQSVIAGYIARNVVRVTTDDLAAVGKILDAGTQSGANAVRGLRFTLKDEQPVRLEALREAALKARASAEAIASALGVKVVGVVSANAGGSDYIARAQLAASSWGTPTGIPTPIVAGPIEVRATVALTVEISQ